MSDQTKIQTAGPEDPKATTRAKVWAGLAVVGPLLSALATFGIMSNDQANAINGAVTAALGLMTAFGFGFAAKKTSEQVNNGTFDAAPQLPAYSALEQLAILRDQSAAEFDRAVSNAQSGAEAITTAATSVIGALPIPGAAQAAQTVDGAVDLVQELIENVRLRGQ